MSTVDRVARILAGLDRPVQPRPEFAESLRADLLALLQAPVHARPRRRLRLDWFLPQAPPRLRLLLVTALLLLVLAGIATATYVGVRAVASPVRGDNGPVTLIGDAGISTIGADGRLHTVVRCRPTDWCGVLQSVAWSPDGRRLAYAVNTFAANSPSAGLHVLDTTTGKDKHLVGGELGCLAPFDLDWSSDGTRLVYACDEYPVWRIYVIEPDGSDRMLVRTGLSGRLSSPSWSLDGTRIAFELRSGGQSAIYLFDLLASRRTLLVRGGTAPAWSPDGTTIAYRVGCGVRLATPDGRDVTPISGPDRCQAIGVPGVPVWSPDGKKIAVGTSDGGIYVMQADGSHLSRIIAKGAAGATGRGRPAWRPFVRAGGKEQG